ncbi:deoxyribose-phosphate aldolase [Kallipyga gabonensis]|uniref:deoxyribose-phosphate aldolase n=1 Tax=Kallipyga gabonensis TaxID=1686287 RepID=UPI0006B51694|nr:deoxyribose-phosphate aldolase [Kallipyga gabonensis]
MDLAKAIDHTLLKPDADDGAIDRLCREALEYGFRSCCVNSANVARVHDRLKGSDVLTCSVVGFPLGAMSTPAKVFETRQAIQDGADEIDMVINIGKVKSGDMAYVEGEIRALKEACGNKTLKVIMETCLLTDPEKVEVCRAALRAGADFVKTSTGFSTGGARIEDVRLMKETVGDRAKVKASGGIHSREEALAMIEAGADRIGASAGIAIVSKEDPS